MKSDSFYQIKADQAVPLKALFPDDYKLLIETAPESEKHCFKHQQFNAKTGELCLITRADGTLDKIYFGVEKNHKGLALASAAQKCPPGVYALSDDWESNDLIHWGLAQYRFDVYKKRAKQPRILALSESDKTMTCDWVDAIFLVRDLINRPTNDLGPKELAETAQQLAKSHGAVFQEWVGEDLLKDNFPAIHMVGRASHSEPRLISLAWGKTQHPLVTLVGKGVCFDSGGLNLKPAAYMRLMKKDMGGAAQVLGLAQWIMSQALPIRLQVYIPAVENSVGSDSFRPGDVLTMRNGLTVEVDNTDAEGRLVLADAMVKACEEKPELLIDFATLTGAARVAVGTGIACLFSNDESLAKALLKASTDTKDPMWQLPLFEAYEDQVESSIADLVNASSSPYAGAITAALFLQHFVQEGCSWAHFDVMAWNVNSKPGKPEGGEAMGIRAVGEYLKQRFQS